MQTGQNKNKFDIRSLGSLLISVVSLLAVWSLLRLLSEQKPIELRQTPLLSQLAGLQTKTIPHFTGLPKNSSPSFTWLTLKGHTGENWEESQDWNSLEMVPSSSFLILVTEGSGPTLAKKLYEKLKSLNRLESTLILTASDGLVKDLHFHSEKIQTSQGQAFVLRLKYLLPFHLQKMLTINGDALWLDQNVFKNFDPNIEAYAEEIKMPLLVGPQDLLTENSLGFKYQKALVLVK